MLAWKKGKEKKRKNTEVTDERMEGRSTHKTEHNFIEFHLLTNRINRWLNWFSRQWNSLFIWSTITIHSRQSAIVKDVYVCVFALAKKENFRIENKYPEHSFLYLFLFLFCWIWFPLAPRLHILNTPFTLFTLWVIQKQFRLHVWVSASGFFFCSV